MRRWQWVPMWVWLAGLGAIETGVCLAVVTDFAWTLAPSPELAPGSEPPRFIDRLDFFDYPDSDQASILAVAQFIGERPVVFVKSGSGPGLFNHILVGALVVAFLFLLFQFCTHMSPPPSFPAPKNWAKTVKVAFTQTQIVFISGL
ncbi:LOW QUALITY PROTEIN: fertilization-influencing membrane protein [Urocitellus parryii]